MTPFRVLQISIVVVLLFGSTWVVRALGMGGPAAWQFANLVQQHSGAWQGCCEQGDNGDNTDNDDGGDNSDNSGDDNSDNDDDEDNSENSNGNSNSNDNGSDDNDNFDDFDLPPLTPSGSTRPPGAPVRFLGEDTVFTSRTARWP